MGIKSYKMDKGTSGKSLDDALDILGVQANRAVYLEKQELKNQAELNRRRRKNQRIFSAVAGASMVTAVVTSEVGIPGNGYEGDWHLWQRNGQGTQKYENGDVFEGTWKNNVKVEGRHTYYGNFRQKIKEEFAKNKYHISTSTGLVSESFDGTWSDNYTFKEGRYRYSNGDVFEGSFIRNEKHKGSLSVKENGSVIDADWSTLPNGYATGSITYANGSVFTGKILEEGKLEGTLTYPKGRLKHSFTGVMEGRGVYSPDAAKFSAAVNYVTGALQFSDGSKYTGSFKSNLPKTGNGVWLYPTGGIKISEKGVWKDGNLEGMAKVVWKDGQYNGSVAKGVPNNGKGVWHTGQDKFEGSWGFKVFSGQFSGTYNGNTYAGQYSYNKPNGQGKITYTNGDWREGQFKSGEFVKGRGRKTYTNAVYLGAMIGNVEQGQGEMKWHTGAWFNGSWNNGEHQTGRARWHYDDGSVYEGEIVNRVRSGKGRMDFNKSAKFTKDKLYFDGQWSAGKPYSGDGVIEVTFYDKWESESNKGIYKGDIEYGLPNGYGTLIKYSLIQDGFFNKLGNMISNGGLYEEYYGRWQNGCGKSTNIDRVTIYVNGNVPSCR